MERPSSARVLVVATIELSSAIVASLVGDGAAEARVVVPASRQSRLQWLTNEEDRAREVAQAASEHIASELQASTTSAAAGDSDPIRAIEDALQTFAADRILIVTRPEDEAGWLEARAASAPGLTHIAGVPVQRVLLAANGSAVTG